MIRNALSYDSLHISFGSGTGEHAMCNGTRQGGKVSKVGVEVLRNLRLGLIYRRCAIKGRIRIRRKMIFSSEGYRS